MREDGEQDAKLKEKLKNELKAVINPFTQKPVFDELYLKEEIYSGRYISKAPDIIALGATFQNCVINHHNLFLSNRAVTKNYLVQDRAGHNMNGVFIAYGPDIRRGKMVSPQILDVAAMLVLLNLDKKLSFLQDKEADGQHSSEGEVKFFV